MTQVTVDEALAENSVNDQEKLHSSLSPYELGPDVKEYEYKDLGDPSKKEPKDDDYRDKKRFRLLNLMSGFLDNPTVYCQIFEVEVNITTDRVSIVPDPDVNGNEAIRHEQQTDSNKGIGYEALSWRWGDEKNADFAIIIDTSQGARRKRVSRTLGLALKNLRYATAPRMIWIDALCINQDNSDERSSQVAMMDRLYTGASQICVWLGKDDEDTRTAIKFIKEEINQLQDFDKLCKDSKHADKWRALLGLMQRDWFSRRWVVQELALARKATVYCGPDSIPWTELAIAIELFVEVESATRRLSELMKKVDRTNVIPNWFEHISELGASLLVTETRKISRDYKRKSDKRPLRLDHLSEESRSLLSLEYLVTSLSIFDCGRAHDFVYALLAISRDAFPSPPTPITQRWKEALRTEVMKIPVDRKPFPVDYEIPYPDVAIDFIEFTIQRRWDSGKGEEKALDILCRPWSKDWRPEDDSPRRRKPMENNTRPSELAIDEESGGATHAATDTGKAGMTTTAKLPTLPDVPLPSWVTNITKAPFDIFRHPGLEMTKMGRKNADPLVGSLDNPTGTYNAARSKKQNRDEVKFRKRARLGHYSLYVKGFRFDRVEVVDQVSQHGAIPASWLELGGWDRALRPKHEEAGPMEPDYDPDDGPPDALWRTLVADRGLNNKKLPYHYSRACRETIMKGALRSNAVDTTSLIHSERNSIITEFCRRTQCVIWNRAMIKTKNGFLGLVSPDVKEGDLVCIIYGCTVPVILREAKELKTASEHKVEMKYDHFEAFKRCFKKCLQRRARKLEYMKRKTASERLSLFKVKGLAQTMMDVGIEKLKDEMAWELWKKQGPTNAEGEKEEYQMMRTTLKEWLEGPMHPHLWQKFLDILLKEARFSKIVTKSVLVEWIQNPPAIFKPDTEDGVDSKLDQGWFKSRPHVWNETTVDKWVNEWKERSKFETLQHVDWIAMWKWLQDTPKGFGLNEEGSKEWREWRAKKPKGPISRVVEKLYTPAEKIMGKMEEVIKEWEDVRDRLSGIVCDLEKTDEQKKEAEPDLKLPTRGSPGTKRLWSNEESLEHSEGKGKDRDMKDQESESDSDSGDGKPSRAGHRTKKERQRLADSTDPFRHYKFLGEAYIHGMMEGEAVSQSFHKNKPEHLFEIR